VAVLEISVAELARVWAGPQRPRLIDVREADEWEIARIEGAELLPLSQWPGIVATQLTSPAEPLLLLCHHGVRSARATEFLLRQGFTDPTNVAGGVRQGFTDATNVAGGIDTWSREVDPSVPRY
jgi:rhodanese-related sulfurtransferase